jgi:large subunit ribosomal protein L22
MSDAIAEVREWKATHRYARISPRKAKLVVDLIRGRDCNSALEILQFTSKRASVLLDRVVRSAMANANEREADMTRLYVKEARVDGGPYFRRWRPKDRGRAHPLAKRTSHLIVTVAER